jgi:DNA-binding LytR/AlgR family response regulator
MHERSPRLRERSPPAVGASSAAQRPSALKRLLAIAAAPEVRRTFAIAAVAGLFLAVLAPFNTAASGLAGRILYWEGLILLGSGVGILTSQGVGALLDREDRRPLLMAVVGALLMTPPLMIVAYGVTRLAFGAGSTGPFLGFAAPVLLVSLALSLVNALADRRPLTSHGPPASQTAPPAPPRFLERLPGKLKGGVVHAVKAEDHYLRIHTSIGSDLVLMRLADAVAELEGLEGAQTHRSWWVARAAVLGVERRNGRAVLRLEGGLEAPVSRNFAKALRDAGWLG